MAQPNNKPNWLNELLQTLANMHSDIIQNRQALNRLESNNLNRSTNQPTTSAQNRISRIRAEQSSSPSNTQNRPSTMATAIQNRPIIPGICWYHRQFGNATGKCVEPCNFKKLQPITVKTKRSKSTPRLAPKPIAANRPSTPEQSASINTPNWPPTPQPLTNEQHMELANAVLSTATPQLSDSSEDEDETSWQQVGFAPRIKPAIKFWHVKYPFGTQIFSKRGSSVAGVNYIIFNRSN